MRAVVVAAVLVGIAFAAPQALRDKRSEDVSEEPQSGNDHRFVLSLDNFRQILNHLLDRVNSTEQGIKHFLQFAKGVFQAESVNPDQFHHLASVWGHAGSGMETFFGEISGTLGWLFMELSSEPSGFIETNACDSFIARADGTVEDDEEQQRRKRSPTDPQQLAEAVELIRSREDCFFDRLGEISDIREDVQTFQKADAIGEAEAIDLLFDLGQNLHLLTLVGSRFYHAVERFLPEHEGEGQQEEGQEGHEDKRIVALLRRYLHVVERAGTPGDQQDEESADQGEDSTDASVEEAEQAVSEMHFSDAPLTRAEFFKTVTQVIENMKHLHISLKAAFGKFENPDAENLGDGLSDWMQTMREAGSVVMKSRFSLASLGYRLYLNSDPGQFHEREHCLLHQPNETSTQEDVQHELKKAFERGSCFDTLLSGDARDLRDRLKEHCSEMTERTAFELVRDFFKEMHLIRLAAHRFFDTVTELMKAMGEHLSGGSGPETGPEDLRRELLALLKRRLDQH